MLNAECLMRNEEERQSDSEAMAKWLLRSRKEVVSFSVFSVYSVCSVVGQLLPRLTAEGKRTAEHAENAEKKPDKHAYAPVSAYSALSAVGHFCCGGGKR